MEYRIRDLEGRLIQAGIDIKPSGGYLESPQPYSYHIGHNGQGQSWESSASAVATANGEHGSHVGQVLATPHQETNMFRALPAFRTGCTGDNYLGVSSGNSNLSSIKGTSLHILGMEIDIADFTSTDMDEPEDSMYHPPLYNKSYQAILQSALGVNPRIEKVDLPPREEGLTYAQWYFRVLNPYAPILHKPTFMKLVSRVDSEIKYRADTN